MIDFFFCLLYFVSLFRNYVFGFVCNLFFFWLDYELDRWNLRIGV